MTKPSKWTGDPNLIAGRTMRPQPVKRAIIFRDETETDHRAVTALVTQDRAGVHMVPGTEKYLAVSKATGKERKIGPFDWEIPLGERKADSRNG